LDVRHGVALIGLEEVLAVKTIKGNAFTMHLTEFCIVSLTILSLSSGNQP